MEVCCFRAAAQSAPAPEQIWIDSWFTPTSWMDRISDGLFKLASGLIWIIYITIDRKYVGTFGLIVSVVSHHCCVKFPPGLAPIPPVTPGLDDSNPGGL
jgi:hypothetical protein